MKPPVDAETLKQFLCFVDLTSDEAQQVAGLLGTIHLKSGETLFRQGDACTAVYLLLSGEVEIRIESPGQLPRSLVTLGSGAILGEMGPLTDEPRGATSVARGDTHLAELPYSALHAGLERGDRWATKFLTATAKVPRPEACDAEQGNDLDNGSTRKIQEFDQASRGRRAGAPSKAVAYGMDILI